MIDPTDNADPGDEAEECPHEWVFMDASFDHEFGTEVIHYWECRLCDATKNFEPHEYGEDDPDYC